MLPNWLFILENKGHCNYCSYCSHDIQWTRITYTVWRLIFSHVVLLLVSYNYTLLLHLGFIFLTTRNLFFTSLQPDVEQKNNSWNYCQVQPMISLQSILVFLWSLSSLNWTSNKLVHKIKSDCPLIPIPFSQFAKLLFVRDIDCMFIRK